MSELPAGPTAGTDAKVQRRGRSWAWIVAILLSLLFPFLVPAALVGGLYLQHLSGYAGTCGPYAPDIPVHPCTYEEYAANFFGGFGGMGLMLIAAATFGGVLLLVLIGWAVVGVISLARTRS